MKKTVAMILIWTFCLSAAACARRADVVQPTHGEALAEDAAQTATALPTTEPEQTTAEPTTVDVPPTVMTAPSARMTTETATAVTDPPVTTLPPTEGALAFERQIVRVNYSGDGTFPYAALLADRAALDSELRRYTTDGSYSVEPTQELNAAVQKYTHDWFATHRLLFVRLQESSGSVSHEITQATRTAAGADVTIRRNVPEVGTCDMAEWMLFIEVDDVTLTGADRVNVTIE